MTVCTDKLVKIWGRSALICAAACICIQLCVAVPAVSSVDVTTQAEDRLADSDAERVTPAAGENIAVQRISSVERNHGDAQEAAVAGNRSVSPFAARTHFKRNSIIIFSALLFLFIASALIGVIVLRRIGSRKALKAGRIVGKYKDLVENIAANSSDSFKDTVERLTQVRNTVLIEIIIDKAASVAGQPLSHFLDLYDATGITDRYLEKLINSKSWKKRVFASEKLGHIGSAKAVPHLLSIIRDVNNEDEDVRTTALRALGRIRDRRAVPFLIEALGYPETWLPPRIGEILVSIGKESIEPLKKELRNFESESRRGWAAEILGWLEAESATTALIESLFDVSPEVRARAAGALGKIKDNRAIAKLTELLVSEPAPFVRIRVSQALGAIGNPVVIHYLVNILKDPEWWVRVRAVEALEQMGEKSVPSLLVAMEDEDHEVRRRAALALERIGYVESILREYGKEDYKPELRKILLHIAKAGVIESLSDKLTSSDTQFKKRIVRILGEAGTRDAAEPLLDLLKQTSDWTLKARVIQSLGKVGAVEAIPLIIANLKNTEFWVRWAAAEALGILDAKDYIDDVAAILDDPNPIARESALRALSMLRVTVHWDKIEHLLQDPSVRVRATALRVMRELGITAQSQKILDIMRESSDEVKIEAIKYFNAIRETSVQMDIIRLLPYGSEELRKEVVEYVKNVPPGNFRDVRELFDESALPEHVTASLIEIGALINDNEAYRFILEYTGSVDESLRERAFHGIASFGFSDNEPIFEKALFDPSKAVRTIVLASIGPSSKDDFFKKAKVLANDPDEDVRLALALAIGGSGSDYFKPLVIKLLDDPSYRVVGGAFISFASYNDPKFLEHFYARKNIKEIRSEIVKISQDARFTRIIDDIRARAKESRNLEVALLFARDDREFGSELLSRLRETLDPVIRLKAIEMLKIIALPEYFTSVLGIMKRDPYGEIRIEAMNVISAIGRADEVIAALASMLMDPAPDVRIRAADLLSRYKDPKALEALLHVLDTSDRDFREAVTTSLSELLSGEPEKVSELVKKVPETKMRKIGMAWLMGKSQKKGATKLLLELANDDDPEVRASAVGALAKFKKKSLLENMDKLIYDPNERVRAATVNAIVMTGGDKAFDIVKAALQDIDEFVRARAVVGLARLDLKKSIQILKAKASKFPEFRSYLNGLLYIAGTSYAAHGKMDAMAVGIVEEICSREKMMHVFRKSPDKKDRLHAFRILTLIHTDDKSGLVESALKDAAPEIRREARKYSKV
jgi:HEAT repeat protein